MALDNGFLGGGVDSASVYHQGYGCFPWTLLQIFSIFVGSSKGQLADKVA